MEFNDLQDAKKLMARLADTVDPLNKYYYDYKWFSNINYTTSSEYHGELKLFIKTLIDENEIPTMKNDIQDLYSWLCR